MSINAAICTSFKVELLSAYLVAKTLKIALYTDQAQLGPNTTAYTTTGEVSGTGYSAGGATLTLVTPTSAGGIAYCDFNDVTWSSSSITARGALIYSATDSNKAIAVLDFGMNRTSDASGNFTVRFPTPDQNSAILRVA